MLFGIQICCRSIDVFEAEWWSKMMERHHLCCSQVCLFVAVGENRQDHSVITTTTMPCVDVDGDQ
jgi:hypothetical protein